MGDGEKAMMTKKEHLRKILLGADDVPTKIEPTGEITTIGNVRIMNGDSTNQADVRKLCGSYDIDTIFIDPPYDKEELYIESFDAVRYIIPEFVEKPYVCAFTDCMRWAVPTLHYVTLGYAPRWSFVWDRCQSWRVDHYPLMRDRHCYVFGGDGDFHRDEATCGDKLLQTVFPMSNTNMNKQYPHEKPAEWLNGITRGLGTKVLLDLFGGSGVSGTLEDIDKVLIMELDPERCHNIVERLNK